MGGLVSIAFTIFIARQAVAQSTAKPSPTPFDRLPPPPNYDTGVFKSPNTSTTQSFTEGSQINVTWETSYDAINLYFIADGQYGDPITVTTGQSQTWYEFQLLCANNNCSIPYSFRAVDAYGTREEQMSGGFYTGQFWIAGLEPEAASSSTVTTASSASSTITSTPAETSSSSISTTSVSISTSVSNAPVASIAPEVKAPAASSANPTSASNITPIGIGIGVGIGGAILIICGFLFFWLRHKKATKKEVCAPSTVWHEEYKTVANASDSTHGNRKGAYEAPQAYTSKMFHEAPGIVEASELQGSTVYK